MFCSAFHFFQGKRTPIIFSKKPFSKITVLYASAALCVLLSCAGIHPDRFRPPSGKVPEKNNLSEILSSAEKIPFLKSLIVVQDGELLAGKYLHGGGPDQLIDIKSISKSILSAVLGIAIGQGYITGIDQKIMDFLPEYLKHDTDPRVQDIAIRHLVTMTSGFGVKESARAYQQLYDSSDWIGHILGLPIKSNPGDEFNYLSFNAHILSAIIARSTGMSTLAYANQVWDKNYGYGYLWWIKRFDHDNDIPFALGHGGQRIAFIPNANAVIVAQADPSVSISASHQQHRAIDAFLFGDVASYLLKQNG